MLERLSLIGYVTYTFILFYYTVAEMHIFLSEVDLKSTGKSITCSQVSQSIDNDLVD